MTTDGAVNGDDGPRTKSAKEQRGIQSVEVGGKLLQALAHHGRPMPLKDLARESSMVPAKAHPYLVSFGKIGLVEQDRSTGEYGLGPLALQLGLMSLQQANPVRVAAPLLADLAARIGHTVAIAVWGTRGPTIVLLEESPAAVHVNMRHGTVFSLADTASGRVFGAFRPKDEVRDAYESERKQLKNLPGAAPLAPWGEFEKQLEEVRRHGLSRSEGGVVSGVSAMSAPVFDHRGAMVLAFTAIGPSGSFDTRWSGAVAAQLRAGAATASARLGHRTSA